MFMKYLLILAILTITYQTAYSQSFEGGSISGNVQLEAQTYTPDSLMGAPDVDEKLLSNAFINLIYRNQGVEIGFRYENYLNPILGYDGRLKGQGIPYR